MNRARSEVKRLQDGCDVMNVKHASDIEVLTTKLRMAEESLLEQTNASSGLSSTFKDKEEILTKENYQLRETVGKQNIVLVEERKKMNQLKSIIELAKNDAEREVADVQSELSKALEQAVKDSDKSRLKIEESRTTVMQLETEKREILQEASKLNVELGVQLNEVKQLRLDVAASNAKEQDLKKEMEQLQSNLGNGQSMRSSLEQQLVDSRQESASQLVQHAQALEMCRKELKLAQKEAAQRVAKFSEHGRAMASDIERLTSKQTELITHLEQRENELKTSVIEINELNKRINDVKTLRSEVANDLKHTKQQLKEERTNNLQLQEAKENLIKTLDTEKQIRTGGEQSLKIALRQQKKR